MLSIDKNIPLNKNAHTTYRGPPSQKVPCDQCGQLVPEYRGVYYAWDPLLRGGIKIYGWGKKGKIKSSEHFLPSLGGKTRKIYGNKIKNIKNVFHYFFLLMIKKLGGGGG